MNDVKLHQIQQVGGQRPTERGQATNPATGLKWEQALRDADRRMETVKQQASSSAQANANDPAALQDEARKLNQQIQQMFKLQQSLSQLYHQMNKPDTDKA